MEGLEFISAWWVFLAISVILGCFYKPAIDWVQMMPEGRESLPMESKLLLVIFTFGLQISVFFSVVSAVFYVYFSGSLRALASLILRSG